MFYRHKAGISFGFGWRRILRQPSRVYPLLFGCLALLLLSNVAMAQSFPSYAFPAPNTIPRGTGGYLSVAKMLTLFVLFVVWVFTTDWVNRDCKFADMPYSVWNAVNVFPFLVALPLLGLTIPVFWVGFPFSIVAWLAPLLTYVVVRNKQVELHERVLTPDHLRYLVSRLSGRVGVKVDAEKRAAHEAGAQVDFAPRGAVSQQMDQSNLIAARQSTGFVSAKDLVHGAYELRADRIMLDAKEDGVTVQYEVDGVWHEGDPQDPELAKEMLFVFKKLAALKPEERRARQEGSFGAATDGKKFDCPIVVQPTKTGERTVIQLAAKQHPFKSLADLGMRDKMIEQLKELLLSDTGIFLFSSLPSGGLSTTMDLSLRSTDRLLRDFISIHDSAEKVPDVENVDPYEYNAKAGETPDLTLPKLMRKQPDVIVVYDLPNLETVNILCAASQEDHFVISCVRAKEAVEALLRVLLLKVPAKSFAPVVKGVLNERLVRKLCDACKEEYEPQPELLKKLGIPADRVRVFYRPPEQPEKECKVCGGIGYRGRTAIFELLKVDDKLREALLATPKLDVLRKVARQSGNRNLQEEGIVLVVRGITSLAELTRVLKQ
ncbi:MAG: Flp pilus assembly complex ATPase component TadA [Planctomycetales bacterium]|nr:Flp pilus assembly complex ATPase component TadA [Planctomycetales bacterium]